MATPLTLKRLPRVLPRLLAHAQKGETVTYGRLAKECRLHHRAIPHMLFYIRDEICAARGLPLVTAIVVNSDTDIPGHGFLPGGTQGLTSKQYRQRFEELRDAAFAYPYWDELLAQFGFAPVPKSADDLDREAREYVRLVNKGVAAEEGEGHRLLKEYVAGNPHTLGIPARKPGLQEYPFPSGDECDVVFELGKEGHAVVEIKNGQRGELVKGIYQVVKYRALMEAEIGHGEAHPVKAFLVGYTIPKDIASFAARFHIVCRAIEREVLDDAGGA